MIADYQQLTGKDISRYLPLMNSVVELFDQHYRYENKKTDRAGTQCERTPRDFPRHRSRNLQAGHQSRHHDQRSAHRADPAAGSAFHLRHRRSACPLAAILGRVPPLEFREMEGHKTIAPATSWTRINNVEIPQLYPVFPCGEYGIGKPDLQVAIDTYDFGVDQGAKAKGVNGWRQDPIWMARLGLTDRAAKMVSQKLANAKPRFPTFWGPNFDWTPDFNHRGSAMIALQEMLLQTDGQTIRLLPAWPKDWNVRFLLHAPFATTVEGEVKGGKLASCKVTPAERTKDVIIPDAWK